MDERVYLGVDGGGSKTEALVIDGTGCVLGVGHGGPSNYHSIGLDAALDHIRQAATQALDDRSASVAAYCLAGADLPVDFSRLKPALRALRLSQETVLHNDVIAIFRAGSRQPFGMAVVCGTGFNAGGISRDGREVRLPALGATTGDQAGGEHFGITALGAAFRAWDGRGAQTALQASVLQALHAPSMETLAEWLAHRQVTVQQIADLAPLVFAVARTGDDVACQLIREQGHEIGVSILAILRRLDLLDVACDVVLGGSVFYGEGTLLMKTIQDHVFPTAPQVTIKRLDMPPVVGAALLAADRARIVTDDKFLHNLRESMPTAK